MRIDELQREIRDLMVGIEHPRMGTALARRGLGLVFGT